MDRTGPQELILGLVDLVLELSAIGDAVRSYRKDCANLTRRIKVLAPLFEELRETGCSLPVAAVPSFMAIQTALCRAKDLLQECRDGSQFVLVGMLLSSAKIGSSSVVTCLQYGAPSKACKFEYYL